MLRHLLGSYPGAIAWTTYDRRPAEDIARDMCESAGCDEYCIDGVWFTRSAVGRADFSHDTTPADGWQGA